MVMDMDLIIFYIIMVILSIICLINFKNGLRDGNGEDAKIALFSIAILM